jgi:hypothetical protein
MELTQAQDDYILGLTEDWNRCMSEKKPVDFVKDELGMAIVTSTAAMVITMLEKDKDAAGAKAWGLILLGAFLHNEGLLRVGGDTLQ